MKTKGEGKKWRGTFLLLVKPEDDTCHCRHPDVVTRLSHVFILMACRYFKGTSHLFAGPMTANHSILPIKNKDFCADFAGIPNLFFFFLVWKSISILSNPVQISQPLVELTYHGMIVWLAQKCIKTTWLKILACIRKWSVKCKYVIIRNNIYVIGCLTTKLSNTKGVRVLWLVSLHGIENKNVLWADFAFFIQIELPITSVSPPSPGV